MKIGVYLNLYGDLPLHEAVAKVSSFGCEMVEVGSGAFAARGHCDPAQLLADPAQLRQFVRTIEDARLEISALSCHGNPVHPVAAIAGQHRQDWRNTVLLAERIGVQRIATFSGCPGDRTSTAPNWITYHWPGDFSEVLRWQWEDVVIPYWREEAVFARQHGIHKIAIEMHPGFVVYNPQTLLRLRAAVGEEIGANFDPSHLFWQGIDAVAAIQALKECIFHIHAKDTAIDSARTSVNGVLDDKVYSARSERSWAFRTVGYGHDEFEWRRIVSALLSIGYDDVLSIEHEDSLAGLDAGLRKAIAVLRRVIL